jgi:ferredoxin
VLIQPRSGHLARFDFKDVADVVRRGEEEAVRVLTSHAATRELVTTELVEGLAVPGDAARLRQRAHRSGRVHRLRHVRDGVRDRAFWARGEKASVRKLSNYECTRDHACARNCPTGAITLGNL